MATKAEIAAQREKVFTTIGENDPTNLELAYQWSQTGLEYRDWYQIIEYLVTLGLIRVVEISVKLTEKGHKAFNAGGLKAFADMEKAAEELEVRVKRAVVEGERWNKRSVVINPILTIASIVVAGYTAIQADRASAQIEKLHSDQRDMKSLVVRLENERKQLSEMIVQATAIEDSLKTVMNGMRRSTSTQ